MTLRITPRMLYRMNKGLYLKNVTSLILAAVRGGHKEDRQLLAMVQTDKEIVTSLISMLRQQDKQLLDLRNVIRSTHRVLFDAATLRNTAEHEAKLAKDELTTNEIFWAVAVVCGIALAGPIGFWIGVTL